MSKTNLQIIEGALRKMMLLDAAEEATAAQGSTGLTCLNQMLIEWNEKPYSLNFPPQDTLSDTCPIPEWAELAVILNLAVELSLDVGMQLPTAVPLLAEKHLKSLKATMIRARMGSPSTLGMPQGAGNRWYNDITTWS